MRVGAQGRIVIPAKIRRELGIEPGDRLVPRVADGSLVLDPGKAGLERARSRLRRLAPGTSAVDELIAERRAEARRESER